MMNDEFADVTFALFALKARGEPPRQLVRDAEALRQQLLHVSGVKKVNILGEQAERIYLSRFLMIVSLPWAFRQRRFLPR